MTLAYAVTAHGSQRLTVDTSHSLIDPATSRAGVYVPGTRGRDTSTFYVVCRHTADEHSPQGMDRSPRAVAALYLRGHLSWPKLGELTGIPYGTAHGLARPYIPPRRRQLTEARRITRGGSAPDM